MTRSLRGLLRVGLRNRARVVAALVLAVAVGASGLVPILAGPGYEMALLVGLFAPAVVAIATAVQGESVEAGAGESAGAAVFGHALVGGALAALLVYAISLLHGLVFGFCDWAGGTLLYALGPAIGMLLAAVWGALAGELARRWARAGRRRTTLAVVLALAGPLSTVLVELALFYWTPIVFAYDPFVGYFSGSLYDTILNLDGLLSYRAASAATLFAAYVASRHLDRGDDGLLHGRWLRRPGLVLLAVACLVGSGVSVLCGARLGHWQTAGSIASELGGETRFGRCRVVYDRRIDEAHVALFARDCDAQIHQIETWLELEGPASVTAYLFVDSSQKQALMGAARTSIAKPWRHEIYLQRADYPHPVLRHELVHALVATAARGPFEVAGKLGGWLPNPGLVEGIAVAAAPREGNLTSDQWAAAMRRIDVLPRLDSLFGLSFFAGSSSAGYTAAGSFVAFVKAQHGAEVLRRWYGGEDLTTLSGKSWDDLETAWWGSLDAIELDDAALHAARVRFDRPSVLARRCPHVVDERLVYAGARLGAGDPVSALEAYQRALTLDPANANGLFGVARCHDRAGQSDEAEAAYTAIAHSEAAAVATQKMAIERLGDLALRAGEVQAALSHYADARTAISDEDRLRTLDIKEHYAADPSGRAVLVALLIGADERGPSELEALDLIGRWRAADESDGMPDYLMARQYVAKERWALAAQNLDAALAKMIRIPRALSETLRLRIVTACALGDVKTAASMLERYRSHPAVRRASAERATRLVARCTANPTPAPTAN